MLRLSAAALLCLCMVTESDAFIGPLQSLLPRSMSALRSPSNKEIGATLQGQNQHISPVFQKWSMAEETETSSGFERRHILQMSPGLLGALSAFLATPRSASAQATQVPREKSVDLVKLADEWKGFQKTRTFKRAGRDIEIEQRFADKRKNGLAVYEGNEVLTDYMQSLGKDYWKGKSVLELGCGTGFGSITAFCMGAESVTASDRDPVVLELAEANFKRNVKPEELKDRELRTRRLKWGTKRCPDGEAKLKEQGECYADLESKSSFRPVGADQETVDVIIGADLTYSADLVPFLVNTIQRVSHPKTEVLFVWCEPALFTWNTDVMDQLNEGLQMFGDFFNVEKITSGKALEGHDNTFIVRMTMKA